MLHAVDKAFFMLFESLPRKALTMQRPLGLSLRETPSPPYISRISGSNAVLSPHSIYITFAM